MIDRSGTSDRVVALARIYDLKELSPVEREKWRDSALAAQRKNGEDVLGCIIYEQASLFKIAGVNISWTHLLLDLFAGIVPQQVIEECVSPFEIGPAPLRAELLIQTPGSYWGDARTISINQPKKGREISIEYIDVERGYLDEYRITMQKHCGPAAAALIKKNELQTFHALETIAVIHESAELLAGWNQIHIFDVVPETYEDFNVLFDEAMKLSGQGYAHVFRRLDEIRTVRRWTFNTIIGSAWL